MKIDTSKKGLQGIYKDWQVEIIEYLCEHKGEVLKTSDIPKVRTHPMILSFLQELGNNDLIDFCLPVEGDDNRGYRFKCNLSLPEFWLGHQYIVNRWLLDGFKLYPLQLGVDEVFNGVSPAPHLGGEEE